MEYDFTILSSSTHLIKGDKRIYNCLSIQHLKKGKN